MQELVSIIIPVFNVDKYLTKCLESVVKQTYDNLEIILIDDGSTDSSTLICDSYLGIDDRVTVIHGVNSGAAAARNYGMVYAKGIFLYTCDSDDYILSNTIESLVSAIKVKQSDFIIFDALTFNDSDNATIKDTYLRNGRYVDNNGERMAFLLLINDEYKPGSPLAFYNKSFLQNNNIAFPEGIMCEDELFSFYTYNNADKVSYYGKPLYNRRIHNGSVMTSSHSTIKKFIGCNTVFNSMLEYCIEEKKFTRCNKEFLIRMGKSSLLAFRNLKKEDKTAYKSEYQRLRHKILKHKGFGDPSMILRLYFWHMGLLLSGLRKKMLMRKYGTKETHFFN